MKRKILCLTGTRADYPRIKSVLKKIESDNRFELYLVVTGSHLLKDYGNSFKEIQRDNYKNIINFGSEFFNEQILYRKAHVSFSRQIVIFPPDIRHMNCFLSSSFGDRIIG